MRQFLKMPLIISVLLHLMIFLLLFMHFSPNKPVKMNNVNIVKAVAVSESQFSTVDPVSETKPIPQSNIRQIEQAALKETVTIPQTIPEPKQPVPVQPVEKIELQEPKLEEKLEAKKQQEKKQAELKKKAESKKKEEQLLKKQREEEAKQLQNELTAETEATPSVPAPTTSHETDEGAAQAQTSPAQEGEIDKYKQLIIQTISRKWLMPEVEDKSLACQLLVHLGPGGIVLNIEVLKESGNDNLDRSARNAIMKASPLPVPENSELFDNFRALRLTFRPQGIISS